MRKNKKIIKSPIASGIMKDLVFKWKEKFCEEARRILYLKAINVFESASLELDCSGLDEALDKALAYAHGETDSLWDNKEPHETTVS